MPDDRVRTLISRLAVFTAIAMLLNSDGSGASVLAGLGSFASTRVAASTACADDPATLRTELEEALSDLDDADYQVRRRACRKMRRKGRCWLDLPAADEAGPCGDGPGVHILFSETLERVPGPPSEFERTFVVPAAGALCIRVQNNAISSAVISVDELTIFTQSDFNQDVTLLTARPEFDPGAHDLHVRLTSTPGGSIHLEVRFVPDEDYGEIIEFFDQALADPSQNVVREALDAARGVDIVPVWELVEDVIQRERGNLSSLTIVIGIQSYIEMSLTLFPGEEAPVVTLGQLLDDRAGSVRATAAVGLAQLGSPLGLALLETALASETNPLVEEAIRNALTQLQIVTDNP